ncbi:MAG TPA: hypothetical protein VMD91_09720 [Candidatus Sulfotelmatobacter sp.]|nr:hypothetical protein [Candidatus Sulfotelmatobacter sp.]
MTDEVLFYERFLADVRRCAPGRRAAVLEVARRLRAALRAPAPERDRRWSFVVLAIRDLLVVVADRNSGAARRLCDFVRENADLNLPRDVALTDFTPRLVPAGVLVGTRGRYLLLAPRVRTSRPPRPRPARARAAAVCGTGLLSTVVFWLAVALPR